MSHIIDTLIGTTTAALDSPSEWERANKFFYKALIRVIERLPTIAREELVRRGENLPSTEDMVKTRAALWESIKDDSMGSTQRGAATRAALFAFSSQEEYGPIDAIGLFSGFFIRAGFSESILVDVFRDQWPDTVSN